MKRFVVGLKDELCTESGIDHAKSTLVKQGLGETGDERPDSSSHVFSAHREWPASRCITPSAALRSWWAMQSVLFGDARANELVLM